jgi:zinc transporter, ZIP family
MEARAATLARGAERRLPRWLAGLLPLAVLAAAIGAFVALGAPGLERNGVPVEELAVERTVLRPGEIELHVRNDGPDAVRVRQAIVNDAFATFEIDDADLGRLDAARITIAYPWIEGQAYDVALLTETGATVETAIDAAAETPAADGGFYALMGAIGIYVGIIPVAIGMLWLPWLRAIPPRRLRFLLALTAGLLAFLGLEALLEGTEIAAGGPGAFGGAALVWLGAAVAYLGLAGVDAALRRREAADGANLALLIAIGIGLHNMGEGLAIGSAYAIGSLALGAALVVGFALHNTTEGLAIVAPVAAARPNPRRLVALGLIAGAPAIVGAWIGASAFHPTLAAFLLGLGAGAIARVVVQLAPSLRGERGGLDGVGAAGLAAGLLVMYATGLLVAV